MKQHIESFAQYLKAWYEIGKQVNISNLWEVKNIALVGMWGSAMALDVIKWLIDRSENSVPAQVIKEYHVPQRVWPSTLMICASYSGNTEETVSAMQDALSKWACMLALTSGGKLKDFCDEWWHVCAQMPTGIEPRAALPYSFGIQLGIAELLWYVTWVAEDLDWFADWSQTHTTKVVLQAQKIAQSLNWRFPFVYTTSGYEAVALRAEQQIQENSRTLAHHKILPEHNHNELLWRQEWSDVIDVIRLIDPDAYIRNKKRVALTKQVLDERNIKQLDIVLQWTSVLQKIISWIYQVDRLSYELALQRWVDPSGMEIIENLKNEMKK